MVKLRSEYSYDDFIIPYSIAKKAALDQLIEDEDFKGALKTYNLRDIETGKKIYGIEIKVVKE